MAISQPGSLSKQVSVILPCSQLVLVGSSVAMMIWNKYEAKYQRDREREKDRKERRREREKAREIPEVRKLTQKRKITEKKRPKEKGSKENTNICECKKKKREKRTNALETREEKSTFI